MVDTVKQLQRMHLTLKVASIADYNSLLLEILQKRHFSLLRIYLFA